MLHHCHWEGQCNVFGKACDVTLYCVTFLHTGCLCALSIFFTFDNILVECLIYSCCTLLLSTFLDLSFLYYCRTISNYNRANDVCMCVETDSYNG